MEKQTYVTKKRAKFLSLSGAVNIPWGSKVERSGDFLELDGKRLCAATSKNAHDYFATDADGNGTERGKLTDQIVKKLSAGDNKRERRWSLVWNDQMCEKYRRKDHLDFWVWNHAFYEAPIYDLRYIANLIDV